MAKTPARSDDSTMYRQFRLPEEGQTMAEYSVILAVITPGILLVLAALSGRIEGWLNSAAALIP
jgi:Flp pilus assembly pilin Flp